MAAFLWGKLERVKLARGKGKGERGKGKVRKGKEAVSFQRSVDLWGWSGRVFFSAFELHIFRVGWVERSDTQHNPCKPFNLKDKPINQTRCKITATDSHLESRTSYLISRTSYLVPRTSQLYSFHLKLANLRHFPAKASPTRENIGAGI